jgi:hypothetical protein
MTKPGPKPAPLSAAKLALLHVARQKLGLEDADYRAILLRVAGVESSRDLTAASFRQVMEAFASLGFTSDSAAANFGRRPGMATAGQVATIRRLWAEWTGNEGTDATLGKWLANKWGVSALRFLPIDLAPKVITALRAMCRRRAEAPKVA